MSMGNVSVRVPNPGTVQDRNAMAVRQPGLLDAYRSGDGDNTSLSAVQYYCRFMALGLQTSIRRVLDASLHCRLRVPFVRIVCRPRPYARLQLRRSAPFALPRRATTVAS